MKNNKLKCELFLSKELVKEVKNEDTRFFINKILLEAIEEELKKKKRKISKVKNPIKVIIEIKTAKC